MTSYDRDELTVINGPPLHGDNSMNRKPMVLVVTNPKTGNLVGVVGPVYTDAFFDQALPLINNDPPLKVTLLMLSASYTSLLLEESAK